MAEGFHFRCAVCRENHKMIILGLFYHSRLHLREKGKERYSFSCNKCHIASEPPSCILGKNSVNFSGECMKNCYLTSPQNLKQLNFQSIKIIIAWTYKFICFIETERCHSPGGMKANKPTYWEIWWKGHGLFGLFWSFF